MPEPIVKELEPDLFLIDHHFQGVPGVIGSYLLAGGDDLTLVEAGPASTTEALLRGIRAAGFDPERITRILLTHIHLDHAGASGTLVRRLPRATVYVHPIGAPHLIDPERLLSSASRIYGDQMESLWGEILPVPEERVVELKDEDEVRAGGRTLRALDTPGHAHHHLAYHDAEGGSVFTGDVAAVRLGGRPYVRPPTPPPELDLELWRRSVLRIRGLRPRRLLLTHFGAYDDPDWHLDDLLSRLFFWGGWVGARLEEGTERERVTEELQRIGDAEMAEIVSESGWEEPYELATNYRMTVDGFARYFRKKRG
jgi:glyoxylase-like metal-dependent hydrolase (beta-lactamase superfamily II)